MTRQSQNESVTLLRLIDIAIEQIDLDQRLG